MDGCSCAPDAMPGHRSRGSCRGFRFWPSGDKPPRSSLSRLHSRRALYSSGRLEPFPTPPTSTDISTRRKLSLPGRLWNPLPPHHEFFSFLLVFEKDGKWVSEYPPGWSIILVASRLSYLPFWLACPIVGAVLLFAVWKLGRRQYGPLGGILAVLLVGLSPFFLFNAASYFSVAPSAAMGILFAGRCWNSWTIRMFRTRSVPERRWGWSA